MVLLFFSGGDGVTSCGVVLIAFPMRLAKFSQFVVAMISSPNLN